MIRRFVNVVAESYKTGVSKHLFHQTRTEARVLPLMQPQANTAAAASDEPTMLEVPPPYIKDPRYKPAFIYSFTVVDGGRTICLSSAAEGIGTYCFDTVERRWRHAGHWVLPFQGRAEYVPDLNLWLGLSPCTPQFYLCGTSDLSAMAMDQPPKLQYVWQDLVTPHHWVSTWTSLISLGSGRFCIVKAFEVQNKPSGECDVVHAEVAVLTGVEVVKGGDEQCKVLRDRSIFYSPPDVHIQRVL